MGKRANGEGSTFYRNGKWHSQVLVGYNVSTGVPKRITESFSSENEAISWRVMKLVELKKSKVDTNSILFSDAAKKMVEIRMEKYSDRTIEGYYNNLNKYIYPCLGGKTLNAISSDDIEKFLFELEYIYHLEENTIMHIKGLINTIYLTSNKLKYTNLNPIKDMLIEREPRSQQELAKHVSAKEAIPIDVLRRLLQLLQQNTSLEAIIILLLFSGIRIGELLALQWKHIDFDSRKIKIRQAITEKIEFDKSGKSIKRKEIIGLTKTVSSKRDVDFPQIVYDMLIKWQRLVSEQEWSNGIMPDDFVFVSLQSGKRRTYDSARSLYNRFLVKNELPKGLNFHRYRHTYATFLAEKKVDPSITQNELGHDDVQTTLNVYTSTTELMRKNAMLALDETACTLLG